MQDTITHVVAAFIQLFFMPHAVNWGQSFSVSMYIFVSVTSLFLEKNSL